MTNHIVIAAAAQLDIYFCDPHSPWQRGTNENNNGLLRQYFAKGTDWKTPAEALDELLSNPSKPPAVASTA
jgi:IS30 family transposase